MLSFTLSGLEKHNYRFHRIARWCLCPGNIFDAFDVLASGFRHCVKRLLHHLRPDDEFATNLAASCTSSADELPLLDRLLTPSDQ